MTAQIVPINFDVARQKALLDSFRAAVAMLNLDAVQEVLDADRFNQFDVIDSLARGISDQLSCYSTLQGKFHDATILALSRMMPSFGYIDRHNEAEMQEAIEYAQYDLLSRYREIALEQGLLPTMFDNGHQHGDHTLALRAGGYAIAVGQPGIKLLII